MILYFTSTGNCKFIAKEIAAATNDTAVSILETNTIALSENESLGFVFPTYYWRLPSIVDDFMKNVTISANGKPYVYFIATYGSTCGQTGTYMKRALKKKGFALSAAFCIKDVDDWTPLFDLSDPAVVQKALDEEKTQLCEVINQLKSRVNGDFMKDKLPMIAVCWSKRYYDLDRRTKHLNVNKSCIGCGKCAKECPLGAIEIKNGKPIWIKDKCTMCLHCLHGCPKFAINYDDKTQNHGQYMHP